MAKVTLITHTPDPEKIIAAAAKLCYSASSPQTLLDGLTPEKTEKFLTMLSELGHESPIEHVSFTFGIEGVSRSLLAQITRHRIASYSVQSQRYVREKDFDYVTPPEIAAIPEALALYEKTMAEIGNAYDQLAAILKEKHTASLMEEGLSEKAALSKAEKMAIEDARFVLPNACDTQMVVTMNARSLMNFFRHRCCNRAQWEIREVAYQMLELVYEVAPTLFKYAGAPCVRGACPEGKMTCGKAAQVRAYDAMRKGNTGK
ncbi:MAG: FAD-dependent thymidylate synthase [Oscillospiraceae bacterium]|nr:FAD-dependent thymidylate synthase [Oscillospiraceae bacterium]MBQ7081931.1 FAD-dependent thymidylate synthase [Oscillospiraceae bacterium]